MTIGMLATSIMKFLLNRPSIYLALQSFLGAKAARRICIQEYARPVEGERVLDIGCGPGFAIDYLPRVDFVGVDVDSKYIGYAQRQYGTRGKFYCMEWTPDRAREFQRFDLVMLNGVLHHLDDTMAEALLNCIAGSLRSEGRLLTLDGCWNETMSPISRWLIRNDRGQFVRTPAAYHRLAGQCFSKIELHRRNDLFRFPYDACVMLCHRDP